MKQDQMPSPLTGSADFRDVAQNQTACIVQRMEAWEARSESRISMIHDQVQRLADILQKLAPGGEEQDGRNEGGGGGIPGSRRAIITNARSIRPPPSSMAALGPVRVTSETPTARLFSGSFSRALVASSGEEGSSDLVLTGHVMSAMQAETSSEDAPLTTPRVHFC